MDRSSSETNVMETWPRCYLREVSVQQFDKLLSKICIHSSLSLQKGISCWIFHGAAPGPALTQCFSSHLNVGLEYPCKFCSCCQARKVPSTGEDSTGSQNALDKFKQRGNTASCQLIYSSFGLIFI